MRIQYYHKIDNSSVVSELPTPLELFRQEHTKQEYHQLVSFYKSEQWQASEKELEQRKALSEVSKPTVNTPEQAAELEKQALDKSIQSGIIESTVQFDGKIYKKSSSDFRTVRLEKREYKHLMSEIASNLSEEQNASNVFIKYCGNYQYIVENRGFGNYRVISRRKIK